MTVADRIAALEAREAELDEQRQAIEAELRAERDLIDAERLTQRPEYPTEAQRVGIAMAAELFRDPDWMPASHHGEPMRQHGELVGVSAHPHSGYLHVQARAPYSAHRSRGQLWGLSEQDVERIIAEVESRGRRVIKSWQGTGWISIHTVPAESVS